MITKASGRVLSSLFTTRTIWGRPFKFLLVLLSILTSPFGAYLWPALVKHGMTVHTRRGGERAAEKFNLTGAPMIDGSASGVVVDKPGRRLIYFTGFANVTAEIPFDDVESWEWQWTTKSSARTENKIVLKTLNEARPIVQIGDFNEAGAEYWHQRLGVT